jgi:hypothetical protein
LTEVGLLMEGSFELVFDKKKAVKKDRAGFETTTFGL